MDKNKTRQKEIAKLLTENLRDVSDYPKAIRKLGPDLEREQLVFLWKKAIEDLRSDDTEFVWFAQFSLRNLASVFPFDLRTELITEELIQEFNSAMHTRRDIRASIIFAKSQAVSRSERVKLQLKAVEHFFTIREETGRKYIHLDKNLFEWIRDNGTSLEDDVVWWIWKQCTEIALTGMSSEKPGFYALVKILAEIVPTEYVDDACLDCHVFYQSIKHYIDDPAEVLRILISRSTLLQVNAYDYYYKLALEREIQWDPSFEKLWKRVNMEN